MKPTDSIDRVLEFLERDRSVRPLLERYGRWLIDEAIPAGGLGPGESERIVDRHLADSMAFAAGFEVMPHRIVDIGSGVGLPGIPLALTYPEVQVTLLDRSTKRCDLAKRAVRILGADNVDVVRGEAAAAGSGWPGVVMRAALPLETGMQVVPTVLASDGVAVIGGSRRGSEVERVSSDDLERLGYSIDVVRIPEDVLDSPAWLLRMTPL